MIEINIQKTWGRFHLDMHVKSNSKRIGILGASGCGKSMTLKCIAGIETPDQGQIVLEERILYDNTQKINIKPQKRKIPADRIGKQTSGGTVRRAAAASGAGKNYGI